MKLKKKIAAAPMREKARVAIKRKTHRPQPKHKKGLHQNMVDLSIRFVLAITFAFSAGVYFKRAFADLMTVDMTHMNVTVMGRGLSILAISLYTFMIACVYVLRMKPIKRASGVLPCAAAILGGFLMSALLIVNPQPDLPLVARLAACALVIAGNIFTVMVLLRLGRSFSILPESRKLVTAGPYKIVRHPLYLAEAVAMLGTLINFLSPLAILIVVLQIVLQLVRIHYEERVLKETFPEYAGYAKRTARLIPGIY